MHILLPYRPQRWVDRLSRQESGETHPRWTKAKICAKGESNPRHSYIFAMAKLYFTTKPLALVVEGSGPPSLYNQQGAL